MIAETRYVHRLTIPLVFSAGLAPGAGKDGGNKLLLARDGENHPVLRGTAIAGVLRHAWAEARGFSATPLNQDDEVARWFGFALGDDESANGNHNSLPSPLRVADARLEGCRAPVESRQHNSMERHSGAVRGGGLFSLEALPPMTFTTLVLQLHLDDESGAEDFLREMLGLVKGGLTFGGHGARGVGMAQLQGIVRHRRFDLRDLNDCAAWFDESWAWRSEKGPAAFSGGTDLVAPTDAQTLRVKLQLAVPRGQDICVGSGMGLDYAIEPQQVTAADGKSYWRLPGSSLRGCFRAWFNRLAARASAKGVCHPPADSAERYRQTGGNSAAGDVHGRLFDDAETYKENCSKLVAGAPLEDVVKCPVADLFGSLYSAGRIHIADALSAEVVRAEQSQHRKHVAVDRITGGASEGMLFDHAALLGSRQLRFNVEIVLRDPSELEAQWLTDTIRALDLGLIRVGSSKSAGRLAMARAPEASGPFAESFAKLQPCAGV